MTQQLGRTHVREERRVITALFADLTARSGTPVV